MNDYVRSYRAETDVFAGTAVSAGTGETEVKVDGTGAFIGVYSYDSGRIGKKKGEAVGITVSGLARVLVSGEVIAGDMAVVDDQEGKIGWLKKCPTNAGSYNIVGRFLQNGNDGEYVDMLVERYQYTVTV